MANEIVYTIKVKQDDGTEKEVQKVAKSVKDYDEAIGQLQDKLDSTDLGSKQYKKVQKELKNAQKTFDKAKAKAMSFSDTLSAQPGIIGQAAQSVKGLGGAFKALLANPIVAVFAAITAALGALFKAFTSTKKGSEQLAQGQAALSAVMDVFRDVLVVVAEKLISVFKNPQQALKDFGGLLKSQIVNRATGLLELLPALGKAISLAFKGKFKEAGKTAGDAMGKVLLGVEDVTDKVEQAATAIGETFTEAVNEAKVAADQTAVLQKLDDAQRDLNVRRAEQNALIVQAKEAVNDENLSYDERIAKLEEVGAQERALLDEELNLERQRLAALEALAAQSDSDAATLDQLAQQRIKLANLEEQSSAKRKEIFDTEKGLRDRQKADEAAALADKEANAKAELDLQKRKLDAEIALIEGADEIETQLLKDKLLERMELELQSLELTNEEKALLQQEYANRVKAIDQEIQDKKDEDLQRDIERERAKAQAISDGLGMLSEALGKETAAGKAAAASQALINTYLGASQVISDETLPTIAKIVAVAGIIATGLKQVSEINKVQTPSFAMGGLVEGAGTSTSDSVMARLSDGEAVINARSTAQFGGLLSAINQAGGGAPIGTGGQAPIVKAYVVSGEVTSQAQMDRTIKQRAKI